MLSPNKRLGQASKSDPLGQALTHLSDTDLTLPRPQEPPLSERNRNVKLWAPGPASHPNPKDREEKLKKLEHSVGNQ